MFAGTTKRQRIHYRLQRDGQSFAVLTVKLLAIPLFVLAHMAGLAQPLDEPGLIRVRAEGIAEGVGFTARHAAIDDAQREALQMIIQARAATSKLDHFAPMLRRAAGYVTRYDVLRHDTLGNQTRVELDVMVNERKLNYDMAAIMLPRLSEAPEVLLVIGERIGRDTLVAVPDFGAAETVIAEAITKLGLKPVSATTIEDRFEHRELAAVVEGTIEEAAAFGQKQDQPVVVLGTAVTEHESGPEGTNLLRNRAIVELRVLRSSDGKMMESVGATAVVNGADPDEAGDLAVRDACAKLAGDLTVAAVMAAMSMESEDQYTITVKNGPSREAVEALLRHIEAYPETLEGELRLYHPETSRLRIIYFGSLADLSAHIERFRYDNKELSLRRAYGREIEVRF